ncbi:MAG TPA: plastocyanin/azurin family copper-binding protein [Acidimicrobiales bacterium]|nr:plastocyanin/azurin family copper-binding protein [Acidimicrobiales bacterium]
MLSRRSASALVAVVVLLVAGCNEDHRTRTASPASGTATVTVNLKSSSFEPSTVRVGLGETVAWDWGEGGIIHDIAFDDGATSLRQTSGTWQRTFPDPGSYDYTCTLHPQMNGNVIVG